MFIISVLAAICSTTASIPQLLGKVNKLSNATMALRGMGALLWCIYGILIQEYALIASSGMAFIIEMTLAIRTGFADTDCFCRNRSSPTDTMPSPTASVHNSSVTIDLARLS